MFLTSVQAQTIQQAMLGKEKDPNHPLGLMYETYPFFDLKDTLLYLSIRFDTANQSLNENATLLVEVKKKNANPEKFEPLLSKTIPIPPNAKWIRDSLNMAVGLHSGNFLCILSILNKERQVQDHAILPFQALRNESWKPAVQKEVKKDTVNVLELHAENTFVSKYGKEQLVNNIQALAPIAGRADADFIKNVEAIESVDELKRFFYIFWYERNSTDPEKAWKEYAEKLTYVAKLYGTSGMKGYSTDRGRLYLVYGEPDKVEKILTEKNARPYEIWFYYSSANGRHNVKFLFFQPGILSNHFVLLHSTETDELINPEWKRYLLTEDLTNDKEVKLKHRVFDYFTF